MPLDLLASDWTLSELVEENVSLSLQLEAMAARVREIHPRARVLDDIIVRVRDGNATLVEVVQIIEQRVGFFQERVA